MEKEEGNGTETSGTSSAHVELDDEAYLMVTQVSSRMPIVLDVSAAGRAG